MFSFAVEQETKTASFRREEAADSELFVCYSAHATKRHFAN